MLACASVCFFKSSLDKIIESYRPDILCLAYNNRVRILRRLFSHHRRMYPADYDGDASFPEFQRYLIGARRKGSHSGYPNKVRLSVKINILDIVIYYADFKAVIGQACDCGKAQLRDRVSSLLSANAEVFFMRRIY